jgi:O-succinylbenzoic acid--CoA ligase
MNAIPPQKITINSENISLFELNERLRYIESTNYLYDVYNFILEWFNDKDFIIQKTSGSTGTPKEIQLTKKAMTASAHATLEYFGLQPGNSVWLCLPVGYIAGKMMIVRSIIGKLNLILSEPNSLPSPPDQSDIDFGSLVPLQLRKMLDNGINIKRIKKIIVGGAAIEHSLAKDLRNVETEIYATYGMTETCSHVAIQRINGDNPDSCFTTLSGIKVENSSNGCLRIIAPHLLDIPLDTNDLSEVISPNHFKWIGRIDNVINSGGIKVSPEEIEAAIAPLIETDFVIVAKNDRLLGHKIILLIEGQKNMIDTHKLVSQIAEITGKNKAPKEILFVEKIPRNASMKIDRRKAAEYINNL